MLGTHRLAYLSKPSARKRAAQAVNLPARPRAPGPPTTLPATPASIQPPREHPRHPASIPVIATSAQPPRTRRPKPAARCNDRRVTANQESAQDEVVGICHDLIRIETTNYGNQEGQCVRQAAEYVTDKLNEVGLGQA